MNYKLFLFALCCVFFIILVNHKQGALLSLLTPPSQELGSRIEGSDYPLTIIDATGVEFQLKHKPQRILSATLASDHILADLVAPSRLVAVTQYVDQVSMSSVVGHYPKEIARTQGEIESMLALQPDVVFIASYSNPETVRYLLRSGIAVVRLKSVKSFADILHNIQLVATVTGSQRQADTLIHNLKQRLKRIKKLTAGLTKPSVLYYDLNGYSVGGNSLMDESIQLAGGINAAAQVLFDGENKISEEVAISLQADVIVMNQWIFNQAAKQPQPVDILKSKKAWQDVPALINNQVYGLPGTWLRSISQHRIIGVEALVTILHPQLQAEFNNSQQTANDLSKETYAQPSL